MWCNLVSTEPPKGHGGKKKKLVEKKKKKLVCEISQKVLRDIAKDFARYRKPTSGSEFNFRVRGKPTTTMEFGRFIDVYFELGLKYSDIKSILASRHAFHISERHLKRILRDRGHSRRKAYSDLSVLVDFISDQLQYSGQLHGYRWMYAKCREHGLEGKNGLSSYWTRWNETER